MCFLPVYCVVVGLTLLITTATFPKGNKFQGHCHIDNKQISYLWDYDIVDNSFYRIEHIDDKRYQIAKQPKANYFSISKDYYPYVATTYRSGTEETVKHLDEEYSHLNSNFTRRKAFYDFLLYLDETNKPRAMAVFENVLTNSFGLIVNPASCEFIRNGGCVFMKHPKIYAFTGNKMRLGKVISLTSGAFGTWHFPMEMFVGLAGLNTTFLQQPDLYFHVSSKTPYIESWFALLQIGSDRIIESNHLEVETLYVPRMAPCSAPFPSQIQWLREIAANHPEIAPRWKEDVGRSNSNGHISEKEPVILLVSRTRSRTIANAHLVQTRIEQFAKEHGYDVSLHQDNHLPSLFEQIIQFHHANIIVAPHGAGLLFTAFASPHVCIIEFLPPNNPPCYSRLAYTEQYHYMLYVIADSTHIALTDLQEGLERCRDLTHPSYKNKGIAQELSQRVGEVPGILYPNI